MSKSAVLFLSIFITCAVSERIIVQTKSGPVHGLTKFIDRKLLSLFLGIPYAKPPVSSRRFKPPEAADNWTDVLEATSAKPACPQNTKKITKVLGPKFQINETAEDCLYLNVYVPGIPSLVKEHPLPVMVCIHGGGFQMASGRLWDMSRLAVYANVIIVTMNFRLGVLGFLSTNDSAALGNWGLLDQRLALQWVKENIMEFGGAENLTTLFGHASGAYSVGLHIVSPMSQGGLFQRAISHGGTIISPALLTTDPMMRVKPLAMKTNCISKEQMKSGVFQNDQVVECLRNVSVADLMQYDEMTPGFFTPVIDHHFIRGDLTAIMTAGNYTPVTYIVGGTSDEGTEIAGEIPNFYTTAEFDSPTFEKHIQEIANLAVIKPVPKAALTALMKVMSARYYPRQIASLDYKKAYLQALGELMMSKIFKNGHVYSELGNIYIYRFTHKPSTSRLPTWVGGPGYGEELPFLFGYVLDDGTDEEKNLSLNWMKTWGRFALTGDPSFNDGTLPWTKLAFPNMNYMEITSAMTNNSNKILWKYDIRRFWNKAVPEVALLGKSTAQCNVGALQCYTCSYKFSGNGNTDYECVSDPFAYTKLGHVSCPFPRVCGIQATYTNKFAQLTSVTRGCLKRNVAHLDRTSCSQVDGNVNCDFQCDGDLCNFITGDLHASYNPNVTPGLTSLPSLLVLSLLSISCLKLIV